MSAYCARVGGYESYDVRPWRGSFRCNLRPNLKVVWMWWPTIRRVESLTLLSLLARGIRAFMCWRAAEGR
eukprot:scaffold598_cov318-Pavlova_lutheri.AAC.45